jgi:hypothetical protein
MIIKTAASEAQFNRLLRHQSRTATLPVSIIGPFLISRRLPQAGLITRCKTRLANKIFNLLLPSLQQNEALDKLYLCLQQRHEAVLAQHRTKMTSIDNLPL